MWGAITFIIGFLLSGIWFGLSIIISMLATKWKSETINHLRVILAAFIPTGIILAFSKDYNINFASIAILKYWLGTIVVATITAVIIANKPVEKIPEGKDFAWYIVDGILMEVPQRLMMQTFLIYILEKVNIEHGAYVGIVLNGLVWVACIVVQNIIMKVPFDKYTVLDMFSSFLFSIGVGFILFSSDLLLFAMMAHGLERFVSTLVRRKKY